MDNFKLSKPPVVEVLIGVQYNDIVFDDKTIFELYNMIKDDYPIIEKREQSATITEESHSKPVIKFLDDKYDRYLFFTKDRNKLIQIQANKIMFNWRKNDKNQYPSFITVYNSFKSILNKFTLDLSINDKINQYYLTYLDEFKIGNNESPTDYINLFNLSASNIKHLNFTVAIPHTDINGTMILKVNSAVKKKTNQNLIILNSTFRGFSDKDMDYWFKEAHNKIVSIFSSILTEKSVNQFK